MQSKGDASMKRSAIWGGATLGLIVAAIIGLFRGDFWPTILYAVLIGVGTGIIASVLGWIGDTLGRRSK